MYQISLKSKKLFVDGRTDGRTYGRTDGHSPPLILLGRLLEVDLNIADFTFVNFCGFLSISWEVDIFNFYDFCVFKAKVSSRTWGP